MIASSIFILALWGALGSILVSPKSNRMMSFMTLVVASVIFFLWNKDYLSNASEPFAFEWLKYMSLQVDVDFSSNARNYVWILPIYLLSLIAMLIAVFNSEETRKQRFCCLVVLNLCAVCGAICAENILQLLICSCLMTVLGFCIIDDMDARKKYAFYNLLADMSLFSVCSLSYGYIGNLDFYSLPKFEQVGAHRDLISILLVLTISLKVGLFMFHNQLYDLSVLHFNRLSYLLLCATPLAGLIIMQKFYPLISVSSYGQPILKILSGLTLCCGIYSALFMNNIKEKTVGMVQILFGFGVVQILFLSADFAKVENIILLGGAVFCLMFYAVYYASSYELSVSKMGGFIAGNKFGFVLQTLVFMSMLHYLLISFPTKGYYAALGLAITLTIIISQVLRQIFLGKTHADERVIALLKNPAWYLLLSMIALGFLLGRIEYQKALIETGAMLILFLFLLVVYPLRRTEILYEKELIQESDAFETIFDFLIITPLTILGRILWLLVDFILIERTIINSLSNTTGFLIRSISKLNIYSSWLYLFYVAASLGLMAFLAYMGTK